MWREVSKAAADAAKNYARRFEDDDREKEIKVELATHILWRKLSACIRQDNIGLGALICKRKRHHG
jgi:hypothetical protein